MQDMDHDLSSRLNKTESVIAEKAKPYLQTRDNERHTFNALEFALTLLEDYKAERAVVVPAMILHDVGWSKVPKDIISRACRPDPDRELVKIHEGESVRIAASILGDVKYDSTLSAEILTIIEGHDTRKTALSINDKIVKDSDKLTRCAKSFWFWTQELPMAPEELARTIEGLIDDWFFLDKSKDMARAELAQRLSEKGESLG